MSNIEYYSSIKRNALESVIIRRMNIKAIIQTLVKRMHWSKQTPPSNNTREDSTHGQHQMVNTEIRLIIFFAVEDGKALYSQQKQDLELTVA